MKNEKFRGISLIVLVITIIVIIILAGAVILSFSKNNPVDQAKEARFKSNVDSYLSELTLVLANKQAHDFDFDSGSLNATSWDGNQSHITGTIKEYITSITASDGAKFAIQGSRLIYIGTDANEQSMCNDLGIYGEIYLSNLSISGNSSGNLSLSFDKNVNVYNVTATVADSSVTLNPITDDSSLIIKVNGTQVTSGNSSNPITLSSSRASIIVEVSNQGGSKVNYTININKPVDATLQSISMQNSSYTFTPSPTFQSDIYSYTMSKNSKINVTIIPTTTDPNAKISINAGAPISSGQSSTVPLNVGTVITIHVIGTDNITDKTYVFNITT